jgi:hypothetical protein
MPGARLLPGAPAVMRRRGASATPRAAVAAYEREAA